MTAGLSPRAALALVKAGLRAPGDLEGMEREDLLALRGVGDTTLDRLEELLGKRFPSRAAYWLERGLAVSVAHVLVREGIDSLEDLGRLTREQLLTFCGLGYRALRQCEKALGRRLPFQRRGVLAGKS